MAKTGYVVKKLVAGTKVPCFQTLGTVDGPFQFPRSSAALAWLIAWVNAKDAIGIYPMPDEEYPGCIDVMVDYGGPVEQYAIEGCDA